MSNSNFNSVIPTQTPLDPSKRVKYTMGLVLGVEEFEQEQYYLMERDRLHQRALHGYGTIAGLNVSVTNDSGDPKIMVSPGIAVNPRGDTICVPENQCASLADWLKDNTTEIDTQMAKTEGEEPLPLYVTLCYKECPTDDVPIPGAPCQSKEGTTAPSRIADYFELSITTTPPEQLEEQYVRCFGEFLQRIEMPHQASGYLNKDDMVKKVKKLFIDDQGSSFKCPFDDPESSPGTDTYFIYPDRAPEILEAVFRTWVTEVRPALLEKARLCGGIGDDETTGLCVLLSRLEVKVKKSMGTWKLDSEVKEIGIDEDHRPILLHTRMLQEWLLHAHRGTHSKPFRTFVTPGCFEDYIYLWIHYPTALELNKKAVTIQINDGADTFHEMKKVAGAHADVNLFCTKNKLDVKHGDRLRIICDADKMTEIILGTNRKRTLSEAFDDLDYYYLDRNLNLLESVLVVDRPSLGDLSDVKIAKKTEPNQVLTWDGNIWTNDFLTHNSLGGRDADDAHDQYALSGHTHEFNELTIRRVAEELPVMPFVTIKYIGSDEKKLPIFGLWFHLNTGVLEKPRLKNINVTVYGEGIKGEECMWVKFSDPYIEADKERCNVFRITLKERLDAETDLRFIFLLEGMQIQKLKGATDLKKWLPQRPMKWVGHDGAVQDGEGTVTAFYRYSPPAAGDVETGYNVVAAGAFNSNGSPDDSKPPFHGLTASAPVQGDGGLRYVLYFPGFVPGNNYIVKGTPMIRTGKKAVLIFLADIGPHKDGIHVELFGPNGMPSEFGFMVEISEIL